MPSRKKRKRKKNTTYKKEDFDSNDGMLTTVWGPSLWHSLHVISFNYPVKPTKKDKKNYKRFIMDLKYVLPCGKCRKNLPKNLKKVPLNNKALKNRENFSRWMYELHEQINYMLNKKSGLTYDEVRERYEHFRARCSQPLETKLVIMKKVRNRRKTKKQKRKEKEEGCTEPLFGEKSKCIIKIVPKKEKTPTFQMDKKCIKRRKKTRKRKRNKKKY
tara:strand:- start:2899 stop:3546 length:648 start_codon:yes stop_codon:yes gene_type:complete